MKKKFIITGAFPEPEWTQVPNKFFDMLPEMEASEALTTLILIRETYGYHRESCKMSIPKLALAAGISENSVKVGAEMAEKRGTFRRSNPNEKTTAEWELVRGSTIAPSTIEGGEGQPLMDTGSTIDPQVRVKEIKENNKETTADFGSICKAYSDNIALITPMVSEELKDIADLYPAGWFEDAVKEAVKNNVRKLNYVKKILESWQANGRAGKKEKALPPREEGKGFYA